MTNDFFYRNIFKSSDNELGHIVSQRYKSLNERDTIHSHNEINCIENRLS